ncbi:MAG: hypothetical protein H6963_06290 [Chromatiaceae bacterium]|nr:hypothetical protein [Chromatiaceae bacterium]
MLMDVADIYDKDVAQSLKKLLNLLEPLMILTLGLLIAESYFPFCWRCSTSTSWRSEGLPWDDSGAFEGCSVQPG